MGSLIAVNRRSLGAVYILVAPAVINTVLLLLQVTSLWDPFYRGAELRTPTAFVGNSNDVGAYLLAPAIAAAGSFGRLNSKVCIEIAPLCS